MSSYGYDARVGYKFRIFSPVDCGVVDPKNFNPGMLVEKDLTPVRHKLLTKDQYGNSCDEHCDLCGYRVNELLDKNGPCITGGKPDHILIPPNSFALAETLETFEIPRDVLAVCLGKSTYARTGIIINVTPLEPEWKGKVTVEISNTAPLPAKVYAGEGIMQVLFFRSDGVRRASLESLMEYIDSPKDDNADARLWSQLDGLRGGRSVRGTCGTSYKDKAGKYQDQTGLTLPKVD